MTDAHDARNAGRGSSVPKNEAAQAPSGTQANQHNGSRYYTSISRLAVHAAAQAGCHGSSPVDLLLSRLDGVRERGPSSWMARCPAHDDHTPSLSIAIGDSGKLLLTCHAGCSPGPPRLHHP